MVEGAFLFYDGLPPDRPILINRSSKDLEGDISPLCYFHHDISSNVSEKNDSSMHLHEICKENDDALLAQTMGTMERGEENIYLKPRGKNYRNYTSTRKRRQTNSQISAKQPVTNSIQTAPESNEDDDDGPGIRKDIIDFIATKKEFVLSLVSDDWNSECQLSPRE